VVGKSLLLCRFMFLLRFSMYWHNLAPVHLGHSRKALHISSVVIVAPTNHNSMYTLLIACSRISRQIYTTKKKAFEYLEGDIRSG
jgi:hypothetical protein